MNKSARILSFVVFVFAVAAVILSLLLAARRDEFRGRADKLAKLVVDMAKIMDTNSSTELAKATTFKAADPLAKTPEAGTLSWPQYREAKGKEKDPGQQYVEFNATLNKSREMVKELQKQRDYLADRLVDTALNLGLPEDQFKSDDLKKALKNLKDLKPGAKYEDTGKIITDFATHVNTRDKAMIKAIVNAGVVVKYTVDEKKFLERQSVTDDKNNTIPGDFGHEAVLHEFGEKVKAIPARAEAYANTILQGLERIQRHPGSFEWTTNKDLVKDEKEYASAMSSLVNDYDEIQKQLAILDDAKSQMKKKNAELKQITEECEQIRAELRNAKKGDNAGERYAKLKEKLQKLFPDVKFDWDTDEIIVPFAPRPDLHAKVVQVNEQYQFAIINIGRAEIREGYRLQFSRGHGEKIKLLKVGTVTRAFKDYSIVELG